MFHCNENKSQNYHNQSIKGISVIFLVTRTASSSQPVAGSEFPTKTKETNLFSSFLYFLFVFLKVVDQVCSTKYFKVIGLVCWLPGMRAARAN